MAAASSAFRLPTDIAPTLYKLRIQASPRQEDFQGRVRVYLRRSNSSATAAQAALSEIRCNVGPELTVTHARVFLVDSEETDDAGDPKEMVVADTRVDAATQILALKLAQPFPLAQLDDNNGARRILVDLVYHGRLNGDMMGLYRSDTGTASAVDGILLTQFESVSARRCFPCWDEPALKAVFELELLTPPEYTVLSNTDETQRLASANSAWIAHRFAPTPLMSTYLVAFVIGKLECIERVAPSSNVRVRCWARQDGRHTVKTAGFALDVACQCLDLYTEWFDIPFPLAKCDLIAIEAFSCGAMENFACITFRDTSLLLYDESNDTSRRWIATTVCHELGHQWFGNIVTPAWWTHLWLNEGFATWMQYHAVDRLFPSWNIWLDFARGEMSDALTADSDQHTHAIAVPDVEDPRLVDNLFDDVTYAKGAAVIRMVAQEMGDLAFQQAIRLYLKRFLFGTATTQDLCQALDEVAGRPAEMGKMMTQWVNQRGYPVLQFRLSPPSDDPALPGAANSLHLYVDQHSSVADAPSVWRTPVTLTIGFDDGTSSTTRVTLSAQTSRVHLQPKRPITWIVFNADRAAFLRVLYTDPVLSGNVQEALDVGDLKDVPLARWVLQDDAFALCRLGALPPHDVVDLWMHLASDPDPAVGTAICRALGRLRVLLGPEAVKTFLNTWGSVQWKERLNVGKQVSHPAELHLSIFQPAEKAQGLGAMRAALVHQLGMCGDATVLAQLAPHFRRWKQRVALGFMPPPPPTQPDLAAARMAVRFNTDGGWGAIAQLKRDHPDCLSAATYWMLACYSQDPQVLNGVLTQLLLLAADDPSRDIALQDIGFYVNTLCHASAESTAVAARFLADHWDATITKRFADPFAMKSVLDAFDLLADESLARDLPTQMHAPTPDLAHLVAQLLAVQRDNLEWVQLAGADFVRELLVSSE